MYHGDVPCTAGQAVKRASAHRLLGQLRLASFCLIFYLLLSFCCKQFGGLQFLFYFFFLKSVREVDLLEISGLHGIYGDPLCAKPRCEKMGQGACRLGADRAQLLQSWRRGRVWAAMQTRPASAG